MCPNFQLLIRGRDRNLWLSSRLPDIPRLEQWKNSLKITTFNKSLLKGGTSISMFKPTIIPCHSALLCRCREEIFSEAIFFIFICSISISSHWKIWSFFMHRWNYPSRLQTASTELALELSLFLTSSLKTRGSQQLGIISTAQACSHHWPLPSTLWPF